MFRVGRSAERKSSRASSASGSSLLDQVRRSNKVLSDVLGRIEARSRIPANVCKTSKFVLTEARTEADKQTLKLLEIKARLGHQTTDLLSTIAECLHMIDQELAIARSELRRLSRENRELKADISYCIEKIHDCETRLASACESVQHSKLMRELLQLDYEITNVADDMETWNESTPFDELWDTEYVGFVSKSIGDIFDQIDRGNLESIVLLVDVLPVRESQDKASYATVIQMIAKRCYKEDYFSVCLELLSRALSIRVSVYGPDHPIIAGTLNCLALAYNGSGDVEKAAKITFDALVLMEQHPETCGNRALMARQYTRTGQLLISWGRLTEGIRVTQNAVAIWEDLLPVEEVNWCGTLNRMAKICNDNDYHDDAMGLSCEIVNYFHAKTYGNLADRYPTIYEVAYARQLMADGNRHAINPDLYPKTTPIRLGRSHQLALREIAIGFACRGEMKAAQFVANYLQACAKATVCEPEPGSGMRPQWGGHSELRSVRFVSPQLTQAFRERESEKKGIWRSLTGLFRTKR